MFSNIPLTVHKTDGFVRSDDFLNNEDNTTFDKDNLANVDFSISCTMEQYSIPPISDHAKENLFYLQAFSLFRYENGSYTRRQNLHSAALLYTVSGVGRLEYRDQILELTEGTAVVIDCSLPHYYQAMDDWNVAVLHFNGPQTSYFLDRYMAGDALLRTESKEKRIYQLIESVLKTYLTPLMERDLRAHHMIETLLLELILMEQENDLPTSEKLPPFIEKLLGYLEGHFTESVSLDEMAALVNVSKYHLSKEFKRYTGFSPHEYLIELRIAKAKELLKTTDLPANKVGFEVGFGDVNNFYHIFKKKTGSTPIQYRKYADISPF